MRRSLRVLSPLALSLPLLLSGCDGGEDEGNDEAADEHAEHAEHGDESDETSDEQDCAAEDRDDDYAVGLSKSGALITATFVSADPAPPIKGDNTWVVDFADLGGQALSDLDITVVPMMPDHGHGTPVEAIATETETPGRYEITPVNLFMTGYWQINLEVAMDGAEPDALQFGFCVE